MSTRTYSVPDISCDHCKQTIERELRALAAVERVEVDVATKTVAVVGDATEETVREALAAVGYDAC